MRLPVLSTALMVPALAVLAACTPEPAPPPPPPPGPTCGAEGLQDLVGRPASVLQTMKFGGPVRFIRPGTAVTMDYREDRLNIEINAAERITRVACG